MLIRLYVIKLSIIVLNEIPIFLIIFAASEAQRIFVSKNTVYESHVPPVVHELTLWFGPIVPAVQKESLFPLGCVQTHSTYLPVTDLRDKAARYNAPVDEQKELSQVVLAAVLVVQVIGMLPYIDSQQGH